MAETANERTKVTGPVREIPSSYVSYSSPSFCAYSPPPPEHRADDPDDPPAADPFTVLHRIGEPEEKQAKQGKEEEGDGPGPGPLSCQECGEDLMLWEVEDGNWSCVTCRVMGVMEWAKDRALEKDCSEEELVFYSEVVDLLDNAVFLDR